MVGCFKTISTLSNIGERAHDGGELSGLGEGIYDRGGLPQAVSD